MIRALEESGLILHDDYYEEGWNAEDEPLPGVAPGSLASEVGGTAQPSGPRRAAVAWGRRQEPPPGGRGAGHGQFRHPGQGGEPEALPLGRSPVSRRRSSAHRQARS
ncbi:hypothetical protein ACWGKS_13075 [Nocardiopsis sp. NPDC055879]